MANARLGDESSARRFEQAAEELGIEGYGVVLDIPRMQLALARGDLDAVRASWRRRCRSAAGTGAGWPSPRSSPGSTGSPRCGDRPGVEAEAAAHLRPNTYLEPFALRALGVVREDDRARRAGAGRFEALGLDWHAEQTRALL